MPRSAPITMTFPPFMGVVRRLIIINATVFLGLLVLVIFYPPAARFVAAHLVLVPDNVVHGEVWQPITYVFFEGGLLAFLINNIFLWLLGSMLESTYGSRWFAELYFSSSIGAAILASALSFTHVLHLNPELSGAGASAALMGILIVYGVRFGDMEFWLIPFPFRMKAKYLVGLYIFVDIALLLRFGDPFDALLSLSGGLCGYLYLTFAPRRGLGFGFSEQYYGLRNAWYRAKRRRAARKFEVYMGKQGRKVKFDDEGRYIDPDEERRNPNDRKWMN